jgi:membrane protein DedA with SNARE-associated domain
VQHFITTYGVAAVFLLMLAESACIPVPSEVIMLLGGALAAGAVAGAHPSLVLIIVAGVAGNVAGSYVAWAVGRYGGHAFVRRWGRYFGRLIPVVRTFISLPAGFGNMPPVRFGVYTTLGCIPWTTGLAVAGYYLGSNWQSVSNGFHGPTYIIAAVVGLAVLAALVVYFRRRRGTGAHAAGSEQGRPGAGQPQRALPAARPANSPGGSRPPTPARPPDDHP